MGRRTTKVNLEVPRQDGLQRDPGSSLFHGHELQHEVVAAHHRRALQEDPDVRNQEAIGGPAAV